LLTSHSIIALLQWFGCNSASVLYLLWFSPTYNKYLYTLDGKDKNIDILFSVLLLITTITHNITN